MLYKRFKNIMIIINTLMVLPVFYVLIGELLSPEPLRLSRVIATALLTAILLSGTIAITITGSAVFEEN